MHYFESTTTSFCILRYLTVGTVEGPSLVYCLDSLECKRLSRAQQRGHCFANSQIGESIKTTGGELK